MAGSRGLHFLIGMKPTGAASTQLVITGRVCYLFVRAVSVRGRERVHRVRPARDPLIHNHLVIAPDTVPSARRSPCIGAGLAVHDLVMPHDTVPTRNHAVDLVIDPSSGAIGRGLTQIASVPRRVPLHDELVVDRCSAEIGAADTWIGDPIRFAPLHVRPVEQPRGVVVAVLIESTSWGRRSWAGQASQNKRTNHNHGARTRNRLPQQGFERQH